MSAKVLNIEERLTPPGSRRLVVLPLDEIVPNTVTSAVYDESLTEDGLAELTASIENSGQYDPILLDRNRRVIQGERRRRSLQIIGAKNALVAMEDRVLSDEEIEDRLVDDISTRRRVSKLSIHERVELFEVAERSYRRRYGRGVGRPKKLTQNVASFWGGKKITDEAAERAGLRSRETARKAVAVVRSDQLDLIADLEKGLSIDAAHRKLRARVKKQPTQRRSDDVPGAATVRQAALDGQTPFRNSDSCGQAERDGPPPGMVRIAVDPFAENPEWVDVPYERPDADPGALGQGNEPKKIGPERANPRDFRPTATWEETQEEMGAATPSEELDQETLTSAKMTAATVPPPEASMAEVISYFGDVAATTGSEAALRALSSHRRQCAAEIRRRAAQRC